MLHSAMMKAARRVLFYGTDTLSTAVLSGLHRLPDLSSLHVLTKNPTTPVHRYCRQHGIGVEVFQRGRAPRDLPSLEGHLGVVASFGDLIPGRVIERVERTGEGFLNVHPSLIPRYQGGAPLQHILLNGITDSGTTILEVAPRSFDTGRILHQHPFHIPLRLSGPEVWARVGEHMTRTLLHYLSNPAEQAPREQERDQATLAPRIPLSQLKVLSAVCPQAQTANEIYNISRLLSLSKLSPSVSWNGRKMKLRTVFLPDPEVTADVGRTLGPGQFTLDKSSGGLLVRCAEGTVLGVGSVVLPFSHVTPAEQFYRNHSFQAERVLGMVWEGGETRQPTGCCRRG